MSGNPPLISHGDGGVQCYRCGTTSDVAYAWRTCALGNFDLCPPCDVEINAELLRLLRLAGREVSRLMKNYRGKVKREMAAHERRLASWERIDRMIDRMAEP